MTQQQQLFAEAKEFAEKCKVATGWGQVFGNCAVFEIGMTMGAVIEANSFTATAWFHLGLCIASCALMAHFKSKAGLLDRLLKLKQSELHRAQEAARR